MPTTWNFFLIIIFLNIEDFTNPKINKNIHQKKVPSSRHKLSGFLFFISEKKFHVELIRMINTVVPTKHFISTYRLFLIIDNKKYDDILKIAPILSVL